MTPFLPGLLSLVILTAPSALAALDLVAPNPDFTPVNQLKVSGNACGPAALLNAFGFGNKNWQEVASSLPANDDRQRLTYIIRGFGLKPSSHLDRLRWTKVRGVNLLDLTDMGNELRGKRWIPKLRSQVYVQRARESQAKLLHRVHGELSRSLKKGLPPILSLQRLANPRGKTPTALDWRLVHGHFVVLIAMPAKLDRKATGFSFRYVDPYGGKIQDGQLRMDPSHFYPALTVQTPNTKVGSRFVKPDERSILTLSGAIGTF